MDTNVTETLSFALDSSTWFTFDENCFITGKRRGHISRIPFYFSLVINSQLLLMCSWCALKMSILTFVLAVKKLHGQDFDGGHSFWCYWSQLEHYCLHSTVRAPILYGIWPFWGQASGQANLTTMWLLFL